MHHTLKYNPTLASYVLHVTIKSVLYCQKIDAVPKFIRLLANVQAISCLLPYAVDLSPIIQPGVVMLNDHAIAYSRLSHDAVEYMRLTFRNSFWIHCQTLSLIFKYGKREPMHAMSSEPKIKFHNLINLRLQVYWWNALAWIQGCCDFPVLKTELKYGKGPPVYKI
jgi:hypothetical protein